MEACWKRGLATKEGGKAMRENRTERNKQCLMPDLKPNSLASYLVQSQMGDVHILNLFEGETHLSVFVGVACVSALGRDLMRVPKPKSIT